MWRSERERRRFPAILRGPGDRRAHCSKWEVEEISTFIFLPIGLVPETGSPVSVPAGGCSRLGMSGLVVVGTMPRTYWQVRCHDMYVELDCSR